MKLYGLSVVLVTSSYFFIVIPAAAQSAADDSVLYNKSVYNTILVYHRSIGAQSALYNGSQYGRFPFPFAGNGHPFFQDDKPGTGSIVYDSILYEKEDLQFDEVQEVVIMQDSSRRIQLLNQRIQSFTLFGNHFVRIVKDSANGIPLKTGYYNVLYAGKLSVLKKEEKMIKEDVSTGELLRFIEVARYYYIKKGNTYYTIKNKGSLLDFFGDKKKDIRQYIRKNNLNYRKDRDNTLVKVTAYYDQLTK